MVIRRNRRGLTRAGGWAGGWAAGLIPVLAAWNAAAGPSPEAAALAVLQRRCVSCHGGAKPMAELRLDSREGLLKGGHSGPAIRPGRPEQSRLIQVVTAADGLKMPPTGKRLSADEVAHLRSWIRAGAPFGSASIAVKPHWAFVPPSRPGVPVLKRAGWVRNPIDAFVGREHERRRLAPRPAAGREMLLRRVSLDLTGLPPTREELRSFLADPGADAYERVVDRLLASPHYGERWARHWLDVWRYSDWYGRRAVPDVWNSAPQIWRWREWLVRSLKEGVGYDRLVQAMLAGDELWPEDADTAVATGYLARNWYALNPNQWMRDNVEHTGRAFLGLTFQCAHCHDHKYDPITQADYFRLRAFFEPIQLRQDRVQGEADPGPFQKYEYAVLRKVQPLGSVRVYDERLDAPTWMYAGGDERNRLKDRPPVEPGVPAFLGGELRIEPRNLPLPAYYPGSQSFVREAERERLRGSPAQLAALEARIAADDARFLGRGDATALAQAACAKEREARVAIAREEVAAAEEALAAATAAAKGKLQPRVDAARKALAAAEAAAPAADYTPLTPVYPARSTGRRRALALWITDRRNPLAARVAVNHLWKWHFGRPLVDTVTDFGRNGTPPSHPELLDWLAVRLMDDGWNLKKLHRLIVTSATYRMDSRAGAPPTTDRENRWLWRYPERRMESELVRDVTLATAGLLDRKVGGPVMETAEAEKVHRRSLYFASYPEDGGAPRLLAAFDPPTPLECYRRSESLVPQQALVLTNSPYIALCSRVLATALWQETGNLAAPARDLAFLTAAFQQILGRTPSPPELAACAAFLREQPARITGPDAAERSREGLVRSLYNHHEFVMIR